MNIKKSNLTPEQLEKKREHMRKINQDRLAKKALANNKNVEYVDKTETNPVMKFSLDETIITNRNQPKTTANNVAVDKKVKPITKPVENKKKEETDKRGFIDKMLNFTEIK